MKLYEAPRGSTVKLLEDAEVPPGAPQLKKGDKVFFRDLDGMYSYCHYYPGRKMDEKIVVHLAGWTEVEIVSDNHQK